MTPGQTLRLAGHPAWRSAGPDPQAPPV